MLQLKSFIQLLNQEAIDILKSLEVTFQVLESIVTLQCQLAIIYRGDCSSLSISYWLATFKLMVIICHSIL